MEVVISQAKKLMDVLFGAAIREIGYMWNCSENVKVLEDEVEKLTAMKETLQRRINVAKNEGEDTEELENWITNNLNVKISEAKKFIDEEAVTKKMCCDLPFCVNLATLHHYGKMATKNTSSLLLLKTEGEHFKNCVFDPLPTPGFTELYETIDLENIYTQKSILKEIIQALKDLQVVGIIGLGGVGKTTLAKEAGKNMANQFNHIQVIEVTQNIDKKLIKKNVEVAARRIINGEKVLIILDDVWEELKLNEVGIPFGSQYMNCKILLTSRNKFVCEAMNAKIINLNPLKEKEAWTLFERVVGEGEWDNTLKEVALKIVKECGGLPLFIQAVGKALKNKDIRIWEATLDQLQDPTDKDAPFKTKGIMQLKVSYDLLESEVAKSCFLLCSMFPKDATIDLERLMHYGLALGIFNNPDINIQAAKHRVQVAVDYLKSSSLLLHESKKSFKMHDLVHDMAILVTSERDEKFQVLSGRSLREWQPKKYFESYKKISLMNNQISKLSNHELVFPHLDTFLIHDNDLVTIPDQFFRGMEKLKLLDMSDNQILSLPQSLSNLTKLHTLDLTRNKLLCEISILGLLTCLEILQLRETGITNIPEEIGQLTNLRLLDVYSCKHLYHVTPGVISKLIRLEQLYIELKESNSNFLLELSESLKILHLKAPGLHYIPEAVPFETFTKVFMVDKVFIEDDIFKNLEDDYKFTLCISKISFPLTMLLMKLINVSEMLILWGTKNLDNVLPDLYPEGCDKLKHIELWKCENVRSLVKTYDPDVMRTSNEPGQQDFFSEVENVKLYDVNRLDSPHQYTSFCNLAKIKISNCNSLVELFPLSVAQCLVNLKFLEIKSCRNLVVVISTRDEQTSGGEIELAKQDTDVVFPLKEIILINLTKLESFYSGYSIIKYPFLTDILVSWCLSIKRWSYGETHMPHMKFQNVGEPYSNINDYMAKLLSMTGELVINEEMYRVYGEDYLSFLIKDAKSGRKKENVSISFITARAAVRYLAEFKD